jgi:hypothetical protein
VYVKKEEEQNMLCLELRDVTAGVLARSFREVDCQQFLEGWLAYKQQEAAEIRVIDPGAVGFFEAEVKRLQAILRLVAARNTAEDMELTCL